MILEHFPASASLQHCEVIVSVFASLEQLFLPHLRPPSIHPSILLALRGRRMDESLQRKSLLNLLFAICLSVSLFLYCMSVCRPACLDACGLLVYLLFLTAYPSAGFSFLSACLCACQPSFCSTNYLSPCLLTCLPVDPHASPRA